MSKKTRAEKRAEEERIIAEMEAAMKEKKSTSDGGMVENTDQNAEKNPEQKPKSDFYTYQPMDERTMRRVRMIITGVCIVAIVVYLIVKAVK